MTIRISAERVSEARAIEREAIAEAHAFARVESALAIAVRAIRDAGEERYLSPETRAALGEMGESVQGTLDDAVMLARGSAQVAEVAKGICDWTEEQRADTIPAPAEQAAE